MLNIKSKRLLKFVTLMGIGVSLLGAGSVTANASSKPYWANYPSKTIPYKINSTSTHYKNIWKKAIKNWNNTKLIRLKQVKSNKKAVIHLTSLAKFSDDYNQKLELSPELTGATVSDSYTLTNTINGKVSQELIESSSVYLNREKLNNANYSDAQKVNVATREIGYAMGLSYQKTGLMSKDNRNSKISKLDKSYLAKDYKGYHFYSKPAYFN